MKCRRIGARHRSAEVTTRMDIKMDAQRAGDELEKFYARSGVLK